MVLNSKQPFAKNKYEIRNTNEFYFFHTKKWIYRLIYNIVKKLNSQGSKKLKHIGFENSESNSPKYNETNKWISAHGKEIVKAIVEDLKVDYPVQVTK